MTIALAILIIIICVWISFPLFQHTETTVKLAKEHYQQSVSQGIQDDLLLDLQTGKISQEEYQELTTELKDNAAPQTKNMNAKKFCSECGAVVAQADKFCSKCGHKLSQG